MIINIEPVEPPDTSMQEYLDMYVSANAKARINELESEVASLRSQIGVMRVVSGIAIVANWARLQAVAEEALGDKLTRAQADGRMANIEQANVRLMAEVDEAWQTYSSHINSLLSTELDVADVLRLIADKQKPKDKP